MKLDIFNKTWSSSFSWFSTSSRSRWVSKSKVKLSITSSYRAKELASPNVELISNASPTRHISKNICQELYLIRMKKESTLAFLHQVSIEQSLWSFDCIFKNIRDCCQYISTLNLKRIKKWCWSVNFKQNA